MKKLMLLIVALVGSYISFVSIDKFILEISLIQYVFIEIIITMFHWLYNKVKQETVINLN